MVDTTETAISLETPAEALDKLTVAEIFAVDFDKVVGKKASGEPLTLQERIESRRAKLKEHTDLALSNITPGFLSEELWPARQLGDTRVRLDGLRVLDNIWWTLTEEARAILGTAGVSQEVLRIEPDFYDFEEIKNESLKILEAVATLGQVELHFQETDDVRPGTLAHYWEPLVVLLSKLGIKDFSLHTPYLENINLEPGEEVAKFNLRTVLLTGFIPETEIGRSEAEYLDDYLQVNNQIKREEFTTSQRYGVVKEMMTTWLPEEKERRAKTAFSALDGQIRWFKAIKERYGIGGGKMVVHLCSVGEHQQLSKEDFERGIGSLLELRKTAGEDVELLVETQGLSPEQMEELFNRIPDQKIVFDVAHVLIERGRYGELEQALNKHRQHIDIIHFSQPLEKEGRLIDEHLAPHEKGGLNEGQKQMVLDFADENKIWVTFESGFGPKDLDKVLEWYGEEASVASD
jgi:hypothetical protein